MKGLHGHTRTREPITTFLYLSIVQKTVQNTSYTDDQVLAKHLTVCPVLRATREPKSLMQLRESTRLPHMEKVRHPIDMWLLQHARWSSTVSRDRMCCLSL